MIYLASAHTHFDRKVMAERFERIKLATAMLLNAGQFVYAPIVHCYPLAQDYNLRHDFEFWRDYNFHMIDCAKEFWIYDDPQGAWEKSTGVRSENKYAMDIGLPRKLLKIEILTGDWRVETL